jgi:hypothetical protein
MRSVVLRCLFAAAWILIAAVMGCSGGTGLEVDGGGSGGFAGANGGGICNGGCLCVRAPQACPAGCYSTPNGDCLNGPSPSGTSVRVPLVHRASGATCPAMRGSGSSCSFSAGLAQPECATDNDCTAGMNGRCSLPDGPLPTCMLFCTYDECQSDADCPPHAPCECRDSASSTEANICVTSGNCAVDSDCGPGGYCSPGSLEGICEHPSYFCHTPKDACTDDSDCPPMASGVAQTCNYDSQTGHFGCGFPCFPPP